MQFSYLFSTKVEHCKSQSSCYGSFDRDMHNLYCLVSSLKIIV